MTQWDLGVFSITLQCLLITLVKYWGHPFRTTSAPGRYFSLCCNDIAWWVCYSLRMHKSTFWISPKLSVPYVLPYAPFKSLFSDTLSNLTPFSLYFWVFAALYEFRSSRWKECIHWTITMPTRVCITFLFIFCIFCSGCRQVMQELYCGKVFYDRRDEILHFYTISSRS